MQKITSSHFSYFLLLLFLFENFEASLFTQYCATYQQLPERSGHQAALYNCKYRQQQNNVMQV